MADSFTAAQDRFLDWVYARFRESGRWPSQAEAEVALREGPSPSSMSIELMPAFITSDGSGPNSTWQLTLRAIASRVGSDVDLNNFIAAVRLAAQATIAGAGSAEVPFVHLAHELAISQLEADRVMAIVEREDFVATSTRPSPTGRGSFTTTSFAARLDGVESVADYWHVMALREDEVRRVAEVRSVNWSSRHARIRPAPVAGSESAAPRQAPLASGEPALRDRLSGIVLQPEQAKTLELLIEASRAQPRERRQPIYGTRTFTGSPDDLRLVHPGIPADHPGVYPGDVEQLADDRLLRLDRSASTWRIEVTPLGYEYYAWMKMKQNDPVERVVGAVRTYLASAAMAERHPAAVAKWREAERRLWSADSHEGTTTIGHLCREAHQEFATSLLRRHPVPMAQTDITKSKARVGAVLADLLLESDSVKAFVVAIGDYWEAVVELAVRQEHGGLKEGEPLAWEDSRRLVFGTLFAMTEIDRLT